MKKALMFCIGFFLLPIFCQAQGIDFEEGLSFKHVIEKAREEKKYLFMDIMATWCGPCKMMDSLVYTSSSVGKYFNKNFISVKVQIDRTKHDNQFIQNWYADADSIKKNFAITSYPTFLFFSSEGKLLGRSSGFQSSADFIEMAKMSVNENYSFSALLLRFEQNKLSHREMKLLAEKAAEMKDNDVAEEAAKAYVKGYLNHLGIEELKKKEHLDFILKFSSALESIDTFFKLFYTQGKQLDSLINIPGVSRLIVIDVITQENVNQIFWNGRTPLSVQPPWDSLQSSIAQKYSEDIALPIIIDAKIRWYKHKEQWKEVVKYNVEKIEKLGLDTAGIGKAILNNMIYNVILAYSDDEEMLNKGIAWMEMLLSISPDKQQWMDTYANLLYKVGRVDEAIKQETRALEIAMHKNAESSIKLYKKTLELMKEGIPTWNSIAN